MGRVAGKGSEWEGITWFDIDEDSMSLFGDGPIDSKGRR